MFYVVINRHDDEWAVMSCDKVTLTEDRFIVNNESPHIFMTRQLRSVEVFLARTNEQILYKRWPVRG
jgi:hypothetical protein